MLRGVCCACAVLLMCTPAIAAPDLQRTLQSLKQSESEAARLKHELEATQRSLENIRAQATRNASEVRRAEQAANAAESRLAATIQSLDKATAAYDLKRDAYAHTLRHLMSLRRLPPTAFFGEKGDVEAMLKTASAMEVVHTALADKAQELKRTIATLTTLKNRLVQDRAYSTSRQKRLSAQNETLSRDLDARQKLQQKLASDHAAAVARVQKFAKQSRNLQELISKLETGRPTPPAPLGETASKGAWQAPVAGKVLHRFGEKKPGGRYEGMLFAARAGGSVLAPAAGQVVFTGPFRDYGPMVLLKHKTGHISLLAGLGDIRVSLNQNVAAGEPLGRMGNASSPALYVELRQGSKTIDPAGWFANVGKSLATN